MLEDLKTELKYILEIREKFNSRDDQSYKSGMMLLEHWQEHVIDKIEEAQRKEIEIQKNRAKEKHCIIHLCSDINKTIENVEIAIKIEDRDTLDKIIALRIERNDVEGLFDIEGLGYLTTNSVYFGEEDSNFEINATRIVNDVLKKRNITLKDNISCFDLNFPDYMFFDVSLNRLE